MVLSIGSEKALRNFLENLGFETNNKKEENEPGYDVVAIKDGYCFLIEFKKLQKRDNGVYRYSGDIKGDILFVSTPKNVGFFWSDTENQVSLTKTARLLDLIREAFTPK